MLNHLAARTLLKTRSWLAVITVAISLVGGLYFSRVVSANNVTWDGGGATNNWSEAANWSGDTIPGAGDVAIFDGTSTKDATIDAAFAGSVAGIQINSGYTGTITHASGATFTIGSSGFTQSAGTFTGGGNNIDINAIFNLNGGTFNAPSGTLNFVSNVNVAAAATFNPNGGTIAFVSNAQTFLTVPASMTLNNMVVNKTGGNSLFFNSTSTLVATGTVTLTDGSISSNGGTGTINAQGAVFIDSTFDGGSATLLISGNATRTVTLPVGAGLPALTVNAPNVTLNASGAPGTITFSQPLDVQNVSSFTNGAVNFVFSNPFTFAGTTNFTPGSGDLTFNSTYTQSGGTFTPGSGALNFNAIFNLNGGTFNAPSGTLNFVSNVNVAAAATFNPNGGTIAFVSNAQTFLTVPASMTLNNIIVNKTGGNSLFFNSTSTLVATGTVTLTDGSISSNGGTGTINAQGAVFIDSTFDGGSATLLISGNATRTVTLPVGAGLPALTVNAPNVTLNASGAPGTITFSQPLDVQNVSSFTNGAVNFVFSNPFTFAGTTNFTPGSGDLTFNSTYTQSGGTFTPGSGALNFNAIFNLNGGTFNAPSGTLNFVSNVNVAAAATFNPNGGTIAFVSNAQTFLTVPASMTLNNIIVNKTGGNSLFFNSTSTLVATGTVTLTDGSISSNGGTGTINAQGAVSIASTFDGGSATLLISGNATRTVTLPVGAGLPALTVNAPNVTLNASGAPGTITFSQPLDVQNVSSFTNGAVNFVFSNPFTFAGTTNFTPGSGDLTFNSTYTQSGGTFTPGSGALNFNAIFNLNGGTFNAPSGTLNFVSNVNVAAAATFNPNGGTIAFVSNAQTFLTVPASMTLNNMVVNKTGGNSLFFNSTSTLVATGTVTLTDGSISSNGGTGTINAQGAVFIDSTFDGGSATLLISGNATRTVTLPVGAGLPALTVNAPNVTLNASGAPGTITFSQPLDVQNVSSFTNGAVNFVFSNPFTFAGTTNFTPGSGDLTFNSTYTQSGGTFTPGSGALNFNAIFNLNGGTFNAPSGTLNFVSNVNVAAAATFNPNGGTIAFVSNAQTFLTVPASMTLNNIIVNKTGGNSLFFNSTSTLVATGTVTLTDGSISSNGGTGTINAQGAVFIDSTFDGGSATLLISGNATRTVTLPVGAGLPALTVNAPNVTLNASGAPGTITFSQPLDVQNVSSFTNGAVNFVFSNPFTFAGTTNFTPGSGDLTFNSTYTQNGGTFTPGSGALTFNSVFNLNGGTFNAPSGTLNFVSNVNVAAAATFNPNGGTIAFVSNAQTFLTVPASMTLNNIIVNKTGGNSLFFNSTSTLVATGTVTLTDGSISSNGGTGTINAQGAVFIDSTFDGGSANFAFSGSADQTFTNSGGLNLTGTWTVNKSSGRVTLASNLILGTSQILNVTSGTLDLGPSFNLIAGPITIGASGTLRDFGTGDLTLGAGLTNNGVFNFNGGGTGCSDPNVADQILIRSSSSGTMRPWVGSGTFSVVDVDVQDADASTIVGGITAFGSSVISNSPGWIIDPGCPITVASQPTSVTACPGSPASFTVAFSGASPTFQWRKNAGNLSDGGNITGATTATLGINPVGAGDTGSYDAVGTNPFGVTATSSTATLSLKSSPLVISSPTNSTVCAGQQANFTVSASGDGLSFQWRHNGTALSNGGNITGANTPSLTVNPTTTGDAGTYDVIVMGDCNPPAPSLPATLTVNTAPSVSTNPASATFCEGATASFSAAANGSPNPAVQWQVSTDGGANFHDIPGATATTVSFTASASQDGNKFRAVFTNACSTATTTPATLTVNTAPTVSMNPVNASFCEGATASFTVAASGTPSPTVQWQVSTDGGVNFNDIPGATATTLSFTTNASQNGNKFRAAFANSCSVTNTTAATLTVDGFSLSRNSQDFTFVGGSGSVNVITASTCSWTAVSNDSFIHITSGGGGTGNGTVNFTVDPIVVSSRSGTMTIAGQTFTVNENTPTATTGTIEGRIVDDTGQPVSGVVIKLTGTQNRKTITDAIGAYHFYNVETTGFYSARPARVNYSFSPAERSFSQMGQTTEAQFTAVANGDSANPIDTPEYFVRQQYLDLLGREPDEDGFNYWSDQLLACGDASCIRAQRVNVAAAFFIEPESQETGSYIYDIYVGTLSRKPGFAEYSVDRREVVGGANLEAQKTAFAQDFVQRAEFTARYQSNTTAESFVDALLENVQSSGVDLSSERASLIGAYNTGANPNESRASVLRTIADNAAFKHTQYNAAFVLTEYFGYLRRDTDPDGFNFWLTVLNNDEVNNYRGMVCSFVTSREYQLRFSAIVTHSNQECGR